MDEMGPTAIAMLDFSKAFNSVDFDILLDALKVVNIPSPVLKWFFYTSSVASIT